MDYQEAVTEFHKALNLGFSKYPTLIDLKTYSMRMRQITEELNRYCEAVSNGDIVKIAESLANLIHVVVGASVEHGLPTNEIFRQVHESNMTKKGGVVLKGVFQNPASFQPVNLEWVRHGMKDVFSHSKIVK